MDVGHQLQDVGHAGDAGVAHRRAFPTPRPDQLVKRHLVLRIAERIIEAVVATAQCEDKVVKDLPPAGRHASHRGSSRCVQARRRGWDGGGACVRNHG